MHENGKPARIELFGAEPVDGANKASGEMNALLMDRPETPPSLVHRLGSASLEIAKTLPSLGKVAMSGRFGSMLADSLRQF